MEKTKLQRIEESYLGIFKFVLIAVLSLALLASIALLVMGGSKFFDKPMEPSPVKEPPKVEMNLDKFIQQLTPKESSDDKSKDDESAPKRDESEIALDKMVGLYVDRLWGHFDSYQKQCESPVIVDKETFEKAFPKNVIRGWFKSYGQDFAESQDKFTNAVMTNPKAIQICKEKKGRGGVFTSLLNWHRNEWQQQVASIEKFKRGENERVSKFRLDEEIRVAEKKAEGIMFFWAALTAFGTFMSIALLLIFSKIETNLRILKQ